MACEFSLGLGGSPSVCHVHVAVTISELIQHLGKPLLSGLLPLGPDNPTNIVVLLVRGPIAVGLSKPMLYKRLLYERWHLITGPPGTYHCITLRTDCHAVCFLVLPGLDSNQGLQLQRLTCYRYTTGQCRTPSSVILLSVGVKPPLISQDLWYRACRMNHVQSTDSHHHRNMESL
ncbi:MAG: hypothetical protein HW388_1357, partial [Dehalococcoidia bacterium]|nr:hypothetical protein [Dehalococcoidia bacterium]